MADDSVLIRPEDPASEREHAFIRVVNEAAFGRTDEADLVDSLRRDHALLSLVAVSGEAIVGHILFSRMWVRTPSKLVSAVALAPVAVLPEQQRKGIGGRIIRHGLELLKKRGESIVIVLGHPGYYKRFGFSNVKAAPLESPFPADAFLALELIEGTLDGVRGPVIYPPAFGLK